jgi:predicted sulfurtransferase
MYSKLTPAEWNAKEYDHAMKWAEENASRHNITGRLRVAKEGFNGTMTGGYDDMRNWCQAMREWKPEILGNTDFKLTDNLPQGQNFPALKVFPVKELVNYGLSGAQPSLKNGGVHLNAKDYHKKMEEPNTVIIDVRNSYEAEIGHFQPPPTGAEYIDPKMRVSTEFPAWVDNNKEKLEGKQIMMFCTGGIRCERASALLREKGLDNIFQMQGGIHRYLEEYKEDGGHWKGHNYTFDKVCGTNAAVPAWR